MTVRYQPEFSLDIQGNSIPLSIATKIYANQIPILTPQSTDGVVAEVSANPNHPNILGLQNRSCQAWTAILTDGNQQVVLPGRNLKLTPGVRINFVSLPAEIRVYQASYASGNSDPYPIPTGQESLFPPPQPIALTEEHRAQLEKAKQNINTAAGAGVFTSVVTLFFSISTRDPEYLLNFFISAGLTWGIFQKNRVCAVIMFIYFLLSKIIIAVQSGGKDSINVFAILLIVCYFTGIQGTFAYHKLKRQARN